MKNLVKIQGVLFVLFYAVFVLAKLPPKPTDPSSDAAFATVNNYYGIDNGLPAYTTKDISDVIKGTFIYRSIILELQNPNLPNQKEIHFVLKIPQSPSQNPLPVIAVFAGFQTGEEAIELVGEQNQNILLGFQYPTPLQQQWSWDWSAFESVPLQMAITLHWLTQQNYIDRDRINILSASFGTIFTPLVLRWLQLLNIGIKTTTLGYGGGDIPLIVGTELRKNLGSNETGFFKILLAHQTWIYEPKYHVSKLNGNFLIVHGEADLGFPAESISIFDNLIPGTKKIVTLPGAHIQPNDKDLINHFIEAVKNYLVEQKAIN